MSGIAQSSAGDVSAARVYMRLLSMDPQAAAVFAHALATPQSAGLALLTAQSTADLQRIERFPNPTRTYRDQFRTR